MTKNEAIKKAGIKAVEAVENESVDFTSRVTDGTAHHGFDEFSATVDLKNDDMLVMYVYVDSNTVANIEQLDELDWEHYIKTAEFVIA